MKTLHLTAFSASTNVFELAAYAATIDGRSRTGSLDWHKVRREHMPFAKILLIMVGRTMWR